MSYLFYELPIFSNTQLLCILQYITVAESFKTSILAWIKNSFRRTSEHSYSYNYLIFLFVR